MYAGSLSAGNSLLLVALAPRLFVCGTFLIKHEGASLEYILRKVVAYVCFGQDLGQDDVPDVELLQRPSHGRLCFTAGVDFMNQFRP
jgi:hypothetical protein